MNLENILPLLIEINYLKEDLNKMSSLGDTGNEFEQAQNDPSDQFVSEERLERKIHKFLPVFMSELSLENEALVKNYLFHPTHEFKYPLSVAIDSIHHALMELHDIENYPSSDSREVYIEEFKENYTAYEKEFFQSIIEFLNNYDEKLLENLMNVKSTNQFKH